MAAIAAKEAGAEVVLLERNSELGIKLMMTGKGRCNLTNAETDKGKFLDMFGKSGKFLYGAFNDLGPEETVRFFEKRGLATKTERGGRVFPVSDRSADVRRVLEDELMRTKVTILKNVRVKGLTRSGGRITAVKTEGKSVGEIAFKSIVIATGGLSYPDSGSSGDGFSWAQSFGHKLVDPKPALTPMFLREGFVAGLEGLSLRNVSISIYQSGKKQDERFGEAIFTERGISGPVILDMSKHTGELLKGGEVKLRIDYKPALTFAQLDERVQRDFTGVQNKMFKNSLEELLPQKLIPIIIELSDIDPEKKVNLVTKEERRHLVHLLKEMEFTVEGLYGFEKAVVTSGGVSLREVDPKTMRSKLVDNLYFAGEVLDLDAPTGGYNLQQAWSTGHLAGKSAAENVMTDNQ
jgi:predicted Rossmann fold flavoprotein